MIMNKQTRQKLLIQRGREPPASHNFRHPLLNNESATCVAKKIITIMSQPNPVLYEQIDPDGNLQEQEIASSTLQFSPMSVVELTDVLGLTIKQDAVNKVVTFLCELSIYTESAQFNISFNAPSSTGKSFIPTEIARLFPHEDVVEVAYCSPTAFFHDQGQKDEKRKGEIIVDLSKKLLIFLDQPHNQLLERLRPLLSHDKKEIHIKITDKSMKQNLRTKNVILRGFPAVVFCTAGLSIDEQEATRFLLLSPEVNQEKLREGILETIRRSSNKELYDACLEANPGRANLKQRILAIKEAGIEDVVIDDAKIIEERFFAQNKMLKPRHQRDIKRLLAITKVLALLNFWWREREGNIIKANDSDIEAAFELWSEISVSQELNLPPYIYKLYKEVILTLWSEKLVEAQAQGLPAENLKGLSRKEILTKHYEVYGRMLDIIQLRQQILPMLETAGLISQEDDLQDKRQRLVRPNSVMLKEEEINSEKHCGGDMDTTEEIDYRDIPF